MSSAPGMDGNAKAFVAAQGFVGAAMQITRLMWPHPASKRPDGSPLDEREQRRRAWTITRARALRQLASPIDEQTSPLGFRKVRNSLEHFDEYLDGYLLDVAEGSRPHILADKNIGPKDRLIVIDGKPPTYLRHIDNGPILSLSVLDQEAPLQPLMDEIVRVEALANGWLQQRQRPGPS